MNSQIPDLIRYATLAPSGHNTQPWQFSVQGNRIRIFPDFTRRLPVVDPDDHALYISLGCALENLIIAAKHAGYDAAVAYFPHTEPKECLLVELKQANSAIDDGLFKAITERQSTRRLYDGRTIPAEHLNKLMDASREEGVAFKLFMQPDEVEPVIEFVKEGNRAQFADKAFVDELVSWIRFSKKEVAQHQDGLSSAAMGFPSVPRWLGRVFLSLTSPEGQAKNCEKMIRSSSALMLFISEKNDKTAWVKLGQSFERVALTATSLNIRMAHVNMPCEVEPVRVKLAKHLGLGDAQPLLLLRIGYADPMPRSSRRPLSKVMIEEHIPQTGFFPGS